MEFDHQQALDNIRAYQRRLGRGIMIVAGVIFVVSVLVGVYRAVQYADMEYSPAGPAANLLPALVFFVWGILVSRKVPDDIEFHETESCSVEMLGESIWGTIREIAGIVRMLYHVVGFVLPVMNVQFKIRQAGKAVEGAAFYFVDEAPLFVEGTEKMWIAVDPSRPRTRRWVVCKHWLGSRAFAGALPKPSATEAAPPASVPPAPSSPGGAAPADPPPLLGPDSPFELLTSKLQEAAVAANATAAAAIWVLVASRRQELGYSGPVFLQLGEALLAARQFTGAVWTCHEAIRKGADSDKAQRAIVNIAKAAAAAGEVDMAVTALESIIQRYPKSPLVAGCRNAIEKLRRPRMPS